MSDFEKFKEELLNKENLLVLWPTEKLLTKNMNMFFVFGTNLRWKRWKIITTYT